MGGSWELLKDKFLVGAGNSYTLGDEGGEAEHTLTVDEMPSHTHAIDVYGYSASYPSLSGSNGTFPETIVGYGTSNQRSAFARGGSQAHNNLPPYKSVNMWLRTA